MQAQTVVPKAFDSADKGIVYDYAIFLDRYNLTHTHCGVPIKITGHEYQFHTLLNDHQVMYEDKYYDEVSGKEDPDAEFEHANNLRECANLLRHGFTVFALVELGENHGRVLKVLTEDDIQKKNILTPEQYKTLIDLRDRFACYEERKQGVLDIDKDIEYLQSEDACVYNIKFDVLRYEQYQEIKQYLQKFHKNLEVDYGYPSHNMAKDKLKDLELKQEALITPGIEKATSSRLLEEHRRQLAIFKILHPLCDLDAETA